MEMRSQVHRGSHVFTFCFGVTRISCGLDRRRNIGVEHLTIERGDLRTFFWIGDGHEHPGLAIATTWRKGAGLADLLHELDGHRVWFQSANGSGCSDPLEQAYGFSNFINRLPLRVVSTVTGHNERFQSAQEKRPERPFHLYLC